MLGGDGGFPGAGRLRGPNMTLNYRTLALAAVVIGSMMILYRIDSDTLSWRNSVQGESVVPLLGGPTTHRDAALLPGVDGVDASARIVSGTALPSTTGETGFTFIAVGDFGIRSKGQTAVAGAMDQELDNTPVSFVVSVGDHVYPNGLSKDPGEALATIKNLFEDVYSEELRRLSWYAVTGNHDYRGALAPQFEYAAREDTAWVMPARWYRMDQPLGSGTLVARFLFIDTLILACEFPAAARLVVTEYPEEGECLKHQHNMRAGTRRTQLEWIKAELEGAETDASVATVVVVGHHPLFSNGAHSNSPAVFYPLTALLGASTKAGLYVCGHEHVLQHSTVSIGALQQQSPESVLLSKQAQWASRTLLESPFFPLLSSENLEFAKDGEGGGGPRRVLHQLLVGGGGGALMYSEPLGQAENFWFVVPGTGSTLAHVESPFTLSLHGFATVRLYCGSPECSTVSATLRYLAYDSTVLFEYSVSLGVGSWTELSSSPPPPKIEEPRPDHHGHK